MPSLAFVFVLAVALAPAVHSKFIKLKKSIPDFKPPVNVDQDFLIPEGQCSGYINVSMVCQPVYGYEIALIEVTCDDDDDDYATIDISNALDGVNIYRDPEASYCPGSAAVTFKSDCLPKFKFRGISAAMPLAPIPMHRH